MFGRSGVTPGSVAGCASTGLFEVTDAAAAAAMVPDSKKSRRSMEVPPSRAGRCSCAWQELSDQIFWESRPDFPSLMVRSEAEKAERLEPWLQIPNVRPSF